MRSFVSMIVAQTINHVIGKDGDMPWGRGLPDDLKRFKAVTWGKPVIMGRKTYESIGKPLAGRTNIVVTRSTSEFAAANGDVLVANSIGEAIEMGDRICKGSDVGEMFVIGGAQIYEQAMEYADYLYVTWVEEDLPGDTFFPLMGPEWESIVTRMGPEIDGKTLYASWYDTYVRNK